MVKSRHTLIFTLLITALLSSACANNDKYARKTHSLTLSTTSNYKDSSIDDVVVLGNTVFLDGSQLYDSSDQLSYLWIIKSKPAGSLAELNFPTHADPSFSADIQGDYVIQVVVTNKLGESHPPATITIGTTPPHWNPDFDRKAIIGYPLMILLLGLIAAAIIF